MKNVIILFLVCISFSSRAQMFWGIDFDASDTLYRRVLQIDTTNYPANKWQVGNPHKSVFTNAYTIPNAIVTDTLLQYQPHDTSVFILRLAKVVPEAPGSSWLGPLIEVDFAYWLNIDSNVLAKLEISEDNGMHWVDTRDSLPHNYSYPFGITDTVGAHAFDTSTNGYTHFRLDRAWVWSSIGDSVLFRFTFATDSAAAPHDGWVIDNIQWIYFFEGVHNILDNNLISIYPNPTKGNIYIHTEKPTPGTTSISVYNLQGQEIYKTDKIQANECLNLQLPRGIYMLRYTKGNQYCVKKILIED